MVEVLVEHDYIAKEPNELTLTKGEILKDVTKKSGGWWEGTLRDKRGLFPDNFVKVIDETTVVLRNRKDAARIRQCRVVFSYKQDHEDELNLNVGDVIDILGEEEEGWWRGHLNGKEGVFPSNFVEEIVPTKLGSSRENVSNSEGGHETAPPVVAKPVKSICEVRFSYKAQNEDELTLKEGDLITLLSKDGQDQGWWKGELNGLVGVFPDNFVKVVAPVLEETPQKDPLKDSFKDRSKTLIEPLPVKPSTISAQRKSLEALSNDKHETDSTNCTKSTPPLPGKKPSIPVKKSPSGSGAGTGIFQGLKKKIVDVVDGGAGSKNAPSRTENVEGENAFDEVHRGSLLADVRASRPKAPGRRPPSVVGKDLEPGGLVNGNTDHPMENISENTLSHNDTEPTEVKPKLREWEKRPAPWLEEMKLNQAKRSSHMVNPPQDKAKTVESKVEKSELKTTGDKSDNDEKKIYKKEPSPVQTKQISKSIALKTPPTETPSTQPSFVRSKINIPVARPQTIQGGVFLDSYSQKKSPVANKPAVHRGEGGEALDLETRIARLEELVEKQQQQFETALDELRMKLQLETELRMKLQVKLEKLGEQV